MTEKEMIDKIKALEKEIWTEQPCGIVLHGPKPGMYTSWKFGYASQQLTTLVHELEKPERSEEKS